jgi:hypothetical protein
MKNIILLSFFFPFLVFGQVNLVPNGSFEEVLNCNIGSINSAENWYSPTIVGTPDLINFCNPVWISFIAEYQQPHSGLSYVGIATTAQGSLIDSNFREYIQVKLLDTLENNKIYFIEYYLSLLENGSFATNNFGLYLSPLAISNTTIELSNSHLNFAPQVKPFNNPVISDTTDLDWYKVSAIYISTGNELFLTIGNFNTDFETQILNFNNTPNLFAYYGIDDISVVPVDSIPGGIPAYAGPDQTIYIQDSVFIGQKISNLPANWFKLDGTPMAQNTAGVYVSPLETTTYVVTQTLNGIYSTDTVTVFVIGLGLEEEKLFSLRVFPNPSAGTITLQCDKQNIAKSEINILDVTGKIVYTDNLTFSAGKITFDPNLLNGVYWLTVSQDNKIIFQERLTILR